MRAWRHPEAFEAPYESMRPWLFTVGRRLAIDARRSRLARPAEIGDGALAATPDPRTPPSPRWQRWTCGRRCGS